MSTDINASINETIELLQHKKNLINKSISNSIEGSLKICVRASGEANYYHRYYSNGVHHVDYIPKKQNINFVKELAQNQYLKELDKTIDTQLKLLKKFNSRYDSKQLENIYSKMNPARQQLINPLFASADYYAQKWNNEPYERSCTHPENLIFETDKGDLVRSKSEVIIANYLHANADKVFYRYECPLVLNYPNTKTVYPDFTIISRKTGRIIYLEHFGMLDDNQYANDFVRKMNSYVLNDIIPGRDVIFTVETSTCPLVTQTIRSQLKSIL